jgi:hypothetical protein
MDFSSRDEILFLQYNEAVQNASPLRVLAGRSKYHFDLVGIHESSDFDHTSSCL